jgi:hypothetical protein
MFFYRESGAARIKRLSVNILISGKSGYH